MNHIDARFATNQITIWRATYDEFNQPSWVRIGVFPCTWTTSAKMMRDRNGEEFTPAAVYYPAGEIDVQRGDVIQRGSYTDSAPTGDYEAVRTVTENDESYFGRGASVMIATG